MCPHEVYGSALKIFYKIESIVMKCSTQIGELSNRYQTHAWYVYDLFQMYLCCIGQTSLHN